MRIIKNTWGHLWWSRALSSPSLHSISLSQVIMENTPEQGYGGVVDLRLLRLLMELQHPDEEDVIPMAQLLIRSPLSYDQVLLLSRIIAGELPTENGEQEAARRELMAVLHRYLNMEDPRWPLNSHGAVLPELFGRGLNSYQAIRHSHREATKNAVETALRCIGSMEWTDKLMFNSMAETTFSILAIPAIGGTPREHLQLALDDTRENATLTLAQLLTHDAPPPPNEGNNPYAAFQSMIQLAGGASEQDRKDERAALWRSHRELLTSVYSPDELEAMELLGETLLEDEVLRLALGKWLHRFNWDSILSFALLTREYNLEWALAAMEW